MGPVQSHHRLAGFRAGRKFIAHTTQEVSNQSRQMIMVELTMTRVTQEVLPSPSTVRRDAR